MANIAVLVLLLTVAAVQPYTSDISNTHWMVLPSQVSVDDTSLPVAIMFPNVTDDVTVKFDLIRNSTNLIDSIRQTFPGGESGMVTLKLPDDQTVHPHEYELLVHGLEGIYFGDYAKIRIIHDPIDSRFAIHVQTDRAIYKPGQTVNFRAFAIYHNFTSYKGNMTIKIYDPKNNLMKQMIDVNETQYGVIEDELVMDTEPNLGNWRIDVYAASKTYTKTFTVDKYVLPKFDVKVTLPSYVVTTDKQVSGSVTASYTYGKPVLGKVLVLADINYPQAPWKAHGDEVMLEVNLDLNGTGKFDIPLASISEEIDPYTYIPLVQKLNGYSLIVTASVTESLNNITRNTTATTTFYKEPYSVDFVDNTSPTYFKPGLPYTAHVKIVQADGRPITSNTSDVKLVSYVKYYDETVHKMRAHALPEQTFSPPPTGILTITLDPPAFASTLHFEVHYEGFVTTLNVDRPNWYQNHGSIQISQNTSNPEVGQQATFTLLSASIMEDAFYAVISNDHIVHSGQLSNIGSTSVTITLSVTEAMWPYGRLVVYYFNGLSWDADSLYFNVHSNRTEFKNKVSLTFDVSEAEPGDPIQLDVFTDAHSMVKVLAVDQSVLLLKTGNDITKQDVLKSLTPEDPPYSIYSSQLHDPKSVVKDNAIQVITDVDGFTWIHPYYHTRQLPADCFGPNPAPGNGAPLKQVEHTREFFPETWLWSTTMSGADGTATITSTAPDTITSWVATAFSINNVTGLGVTESPAKTTTFRPFFVSLSLPYSVIRGEEVVLHANVFNYMGEDQNVVVTLERSDDFEVIERNAHGQPTYSSKNVVKNVDVKAGEAASVFIPIVPRIIGVASLSVKAQTILAADGVRRDLLVEAEGSPVHLNVPLMLNGSSDVDVQLAFPPNLVSDSESIRVIAVGDKMGPTFKNLKKLVRMPTGCGEQTMIGLAPDVFVYNYLKTTNQLTPDMEDMLTSYILKGYQRELTFQRNDGSFSAWGQSDYSGSMWLTAFAIKSFAQAKDVIYISNDVIERAFQWCLQHQSSDGSFYEPGNIIHTSMMGGSSTSKSALTAYVLIALSEYTSRRSSNDYYTQKLRRSVQYLERNVARVSVVHELALVSYALAKSSHALSNTDSHTAPIVFDTFMKKVVKMNDTLHWSESNPASGNSWELFYHQQSALDIEITAYGLLYLVESRQTANMMPIVRWLISQQNSLGGFRSTQDTVMALQALAESSVLESLDMDITVKSGSYQETLHVDNSNAMVLHIAHVPAQSLVLSRPVTPPNQSPGLPGYEPNYSTASINVKGQGNGTSLVHVSVTFNVESQVSLAAFNLTTTVIRDSLSSLVVETCAQYLLGDYEPGRMAVIELNVPSGFVPEVTSVETKTPGVKKKEVIQQTVVLYYDQIAPYKPTCATLEMVRAEMVAKAKPAVVKVYDYYKPENHGLDFYSSHLLENSDFCDICTSCGC